MPLECFMDSGSSRSLDVFSVGMSTARGLIVESLIAEPLADEEPGSYPNTAIFGHVLRQLKVAFGVGHGLSFILPDDVHFFPDKRHIEVMAF